MSGGGHIIIRQALKMALSDPLVHGALPMADQAAIDPILAKDVNDWSHREQRTCMQSFCWAEQHI